MMRAAAYVALAEMRAITHAEGKPSSYPKLLAGGASTRRPGPARARTMDHGGADRRHRLLAAMKHR
jgi:hypothetical protein